MNTWLNWLRHAFAISSVQEMSAEEERVVDRIAQEVVRRQLAVPALAFLEMSRPLNFVAAQTLHFLAPVLTVLTTSAEHETLAHFLERRESVEILGQRIEAWEAKADQAITSPANSDGSDQPSAESPPAD